MIQFFMIQCGYRIHKQSKRSKKMKNVIVTGGAKGIGASCVRAFAEAGYNVILNYKTSEKKALELCRELNDEGHTVYPVCADASIAEQARRIVSMCECKFGSVDILVNNAGVSRIGVIESVSEEEYRNVVDGNFKTCFNMCRAVAPYMREKAGRIINISSMWGLVGASCEALYSSSKSAVIGLTRSLAKELAMSGTTVNCVAPGFIDTDMNAHLTPDEKAEIISETPLARAGIPEDVTNAVLFFASASSSFITGQVLCVDGGFTL